MVTTNGTETDHQSLHTCSLLMTRFRNWCLIDDWNMATILFYSLSLLEWAMCLIICSSVVLTNKSLKQKKAWWTWVRVMCPWNSGINKGCDWPQLYQSWLYLTTEETRKWPNFKKLSTAEWISLWCKCFSLYPFKEHEYLPQVVRPAWRE